VLNHAKKMLRTPLVTICGNYQPPSDTIATTQKNTIATTLETLATTYKSMSRKLAIENHASI